MLDYPIYALLFLIPAYLVRFEIFGIPTNLWELMFAAVFLSWLASIFGFGSVASNAAQAVWRMALSAGSGVLRRQFGEWRGKLKRFSILHSPFSILSFGFLLLFLGLALGTAMSPEPRSSLGALKGWFVEPFLFAIMIRATLTRSEQQKKAFAALALSGVGVALAAIVYWFLGDLTFDGRMRAFYESPNMLAMQIAPALIIFALELSSKLKVQSEKLQLKTKNWWIVLYAGALLLLITGLFLTRSTGAVSALLVTFFLWWGWGKFWGKPWEKRVGILFVGVALLLPLASFFIDPWALAPSSLASRLMIWKSALFVARDHWIFGRGLATFQHDYIAYQSHFPPYLEWAVPHPHNIFLGTLLAGGILGLAGMVLILVHAFKTFREQFSKQSIVASAAFFVLLYLLLHGIIDNTLWRGDAALLWGSALSLFLAGISHTLTKISAKKKGG